MGTVKYLLDTHTLLWLLRGSKELSNTAKATLNDTSVKKYVSAVSAYEIMYKYKLGKLQGFEDIAENYFDVLQKLGAEELPINTHHAHFAGKMEWEHRDPFDRLLAAQAVTDNITLITNDDAFQDASWIKVLW